MKKFKRVILFSVLFFLVSNTSVLANGETIAPVVKRLQGKNRIETSIEVSKEAFKSSITYISFQALIYSETVLLFIESKFLVTSLVIVFIVA